MRSGGEYREAARRHRRILSDFFAQPKREASRKPQAEWLAIYGRTSTTSAQPELALHRRRSADRRGFDHHRGAIMVQLSLFGRVPRARALAWQASAMRMAPRTAAHAAFRGTWLVVMYGVGRAEGWPGMGDDAGTRRQLDDREYRLRALWVCASINSTTAKFAKRSNSPIVSSTGGKLYRSDRLDDGRSPSRHRAALPRRPEKRAHHIERCWCIWRLDVENRGSSASGSICGCPRILSRRVSFGCKLRRSALRAVERNIEEGAPRTRPDVLQRAGQAACPIAFLPRSRRAERYAPRCSTIRPPPIRL